MDFVEYFYTEVCGCYPFENDDAKKETQKVINYLIDCGISNGDIIKVIEGCKDIDVITFDCLPDWLWEDSLLEKNTFYYHSLLHMVSKPPKWDPLTGKTTVSKFYIEMMIHFSVKDVVLYFYNNFNIDPDLMDPKRDEGSAKYLLNKYKYDFIKPIDFVLTLIDYAKNMDEERRIRNILDIGQYESDVYNHLKTIVEEAKASHSDKIVWR